MEISFKVWFEAYEDHKNKIIQSATGREFPFTSWFEGKERIYLPFQPTSGNEEEDDQDVIDAVKEFKGGGKFPESPDGYEVVDYKLGHAIPKGGKKNRIYKISAILQAMLDTDLENLRQQHAAGELSDIKYEKEKHSTLKYGKERITTFQNSPQRIKQTDYLVAISHNIHDIGKMSTDRNWTSCTNLDTGSNRASVYCEVKKGGFVAYLIDNDDLEINKPKARIWIRRFDKKTKGEVRSIAIPEESIYGDDVPGFVEFVKKWIESKQGKIKFGTYTKRGGSYSDTFGDKELVLPNDEKSLIRYLQKKESPSYAMVSAILGKLEQIDNKKKLSPENAKFLYDLIKRTNHQLYLPKLLSNHPDLAQFEDFGDALLGHRTKDVFEKSSPQTQAQVRANTINFLLANLTYPSPLIGSGKEGYGEIGFYNELIDKALILKPLPESIIQKLIDFHNQLKTKPISNAEKQRYSTFNEIGKFEKNITNHIIHTLSMVNADSPSVVRFYQQIVRENNGFNFHDYDMNSLAYAVARLGINGRVFLPQLKQELEEYQRSQPKQFDANKGSPEAAGWKHLMNNREIEKIPRVVEIYNHVIDSIENGTGRSNKYSIW